MEGEGERKRERRIGGEQSTGDGGGNGAQWRFSVERERESVGRRGRGQGEGEIGRVTPMVVPGVASRGVGWCDHRRSGERREEQSKGDGDGGRWTRMKQSKAGKSRAEQKGWQEERDGGLSGGFVSSEVGLASTRIDVSVGSS
jgi:hypothetical protein